MHVSDNAKASFFRDLADLLDRHPWAGFTYTNRDDGVHVSDLTSPERWAKWNIGFPGDQGDNARQIAKELSEKAGR